MNQDTYKAHIMDRFMTTKEQVEFDAKYDKARWAERREFSEKNSIHLEVLLLRKMVEELERRMALQTDEELGL